MENKFQNANTKAVIESIFRIICSPFQKRRPDMVNKTTLIIAAGSGFILKIGLMKSGNLSIYLDLKAG
ncbi:MAG: hypothetical protein ABUT20_35595 [Bacteroidota bacterium]